MLGRDNEVPSLPVQAQMVSIGVQCLSRNASNLQPNHGVGDMNQAEENRHEGGDYKGHEPDGLLNRVHSSSIGQT